MAEESGSRTHAGPPAAPTGFEVRPPHRERFPSVACESAVYQPCPRSRPADAALGELVLLRLCADRDAVVMLYELQRHRRRPLVAVRESGCVLLQPEGFAPVRRAQLRVV